jgi:hypothetical protein
VRDGVDVLVTNPRLVQTGLDLIDFPSVVWVEIDYSVYVLRQASRRSWRIGQRHPVEVTFLTYAGTLQAEALGLVAAKTRASLMVEGELPEEGLAALDGDGGDVYLALARRLAGSEAGVDSKAQSLEALFAEARRSEDEADELLAEGDWEMDPELPAEPIPFPLHAAPRGVAERPPIVRDRRCGAHVRGRDGQRQGHHARGACPDGPAAEAAAQARAGRAAGPVRQLVEKPAHREGTLLPLCMRRPFCFL